MEVLKILCLAASPTDLVQNAFDREFREIEAKLKAAKYRDRIRMIKQGAVRLGDLRDTLLEHRPQVVHFSGHGTRDALMLVNDQGEAAPVRADTLGALFGALGEQVRLVFLNACFSEPHAQAINQHVDFVIGMEQRIRLDAAIEFARSFYASIGAAYTIRQGLEVATAMIHDNPEQPRPRLLSRNGADADTRLCGAAPAPSARQATPQPGRALSRMALLLDRSTQWERLTNKCITADDPVAFLAFGHASQDLNLFCERVHNYLNEECPRTHRVCRLLFEIYGDRAITGADWDYRLRTALYPGLTTVAALSRATMLDPVMLILGNGPLRDLDDDQTDALIEFLGHRLPMHIAEARCENPVRVLVPIEIDRGSQQSGLHDPLVRAVDRALRRERTPGQGAAFRVETLIELTFPEWSEVESQLHQELGVYDGAFLQDCQAIYQEVAALPSGERSFAHLADRLNARLEHHRAGRPRPAGRT